MKKPSNSEKLEKVISMNTYFQKKDLDKEKEFGKRVKSIAKSISVLKEKVSNSKNIICTVKEFVKEDKYGLQATLALIGLSDEKFYRIITFLRIKGTKLKIKSKWVSEEFKSEWKMKKIKNMITEDPQFLNDLIDILFGRKKKILLSVFSTFYAKRLDNSKLKFDEDAIYDTIVRYSTFGSYSAVAGLQSEGQIRAILKKNKIAFESGKVKKIRRNIDIVIPSKNKPKIFIESSFLETTSSGQGDKAKTEISVWEDIKRNYPKSKFINFIDGIGWLVRKGDLKRLVSSSDYVFTYHKKELKSFEKLIRKLVV